MRLFITALLQVERAEIGIGVGGLGLVFQIVRIGFNQRARKVAIFEETPLDDIELALPPGEITDPVSTLGMFIDPRRLARVDREDPAGRGIGILEMLVGAVQFPLGLVNAAKQVEGASPPALRVGRHFIGRLGRIIVDNLGPDGIEHFEPSHRRQSVCQVFQHEFNQILCLGFPTFRFRPRCRGHKRQAAHY